MNEEKIYALKVHPRYTEAVYQSLCEGEARYGWSYEETADLHKLQERILQDGIQTLSGEEIACNQKFLLSIEPGDYVVYINVPEAGKCTLAKVDKPYYWKWEDPDFNHRLGVETGSVKTFDRNDPNIHPALAVRLKLRGRWWRIYLQHEFESLLSWLNGNGTSTPTTAQTPNLGYFSEGIKPLLGQITKLIHHTHPNIALESLVTEVLKAIPTVKEAYRQGGAGDHGADVIAIVEQENPLTGDLRQMKCVVQVKSFEGEQWDTRAVDDIRRAFKAYPDADLGLIVSTASKAGPTLEAELDRLKTDEGKDVALLIGEDFALFVLKYGQHLLSKSSSD